MKRVLLSALPLLVLFQLSHAQAPPSDEQLLERAQEIHQKALTLDTHVDIPGTQYATEELDPGVDQPDLRSDLVDMKKGGVDGVFLAAYTAQRQEFDDVTYERLHQEVLAKIEAIRRLPKMHPAQCELAVSPADVERISRTGKRAIMIGIENAYPVGKSLDRLRQYHELGVRYITLSHSSHNQICDSSSPDEPRHDGLSEFGRDVVREMNRLGIMCDASHISPRSFSDLLEITRAPIIASHSGCYSLTPHDRNLTDDQLRKLAKNGGVVQVVSVPSFIESRQYLAASTKLREEIGLPPRRVIWRMSSEDREALSGKMDAFENRVEELQKTVPGPSLEYYVNHIDHAAKIAGIDHVGIGTDFDGGGGVPGFQNQSEALNVTEELLRRGYSAEDIVKIWGGNLLRVWRAVEAASVQPATGT
jgi:membrane dipeptidase